MEFQKFAVGGMSCAACSAHVDKAVRAVDGVSQVSVNLLTNSMTVSFEPPATVKTICDAVLKAGYTASVDDNSPKEPSDETAGLVKRLVISLVLLLPLMYVTMGYVMWDWKLPSFMTKQPIAIGVFELVVTLAVMFVNRKFFISGFKSFLRKAPNMDALVALGSGAAFVYSSAVLVKLANTGDSHYLHDMYFESSAMILTLITVGKMLESLSKRRTTDAVKSLISLAPKTATLIVDGKETVVPAEQVRIGDIFSVKPGESIPVDGVVISGESAVDESALTGESIPVDKAENSKVSSATINQSGHLICRATHVGEDTTLSRIISMVENAASSKAPISKAADKVSGIFVPTVIVIALITGAVWLLLGKSVGFSLARAISVLVISCPCALGLATPVAIMVGSGVGAKNGVLYKNAEVLELCGKTDIAIFDKTGTITFGKPAVTDVICAEGITDEELMSVAFALEEKSEHPLAKAIMQTATDTSEYPSAENFKALPGSGVSANINGKPSICGNLSLMHKYNVDCLGLENTAATLSSQGKTPLYFALGGRLLGVIAVSDKIRDDSKNAISQLKDMGIATVMLTGDNKVTANAVAREVGVDLVISDVLPQGKDTAVKVLSQYGKTVMVGDGINDAPALIRADVGIAMGEGSDTAVEAGNVVVMRPSLETVVTAIRLSRRVLRNIHENLFWAFMYNCIGIPVAAGAFVSFGLTLSPMLGAAAMSLSSFCVVSNSLRLNMFKASSKQHDYKKSMVKLPQNIIAEIQSQMEELKMKKTVYIEGMMCKHCTSHVKKVLEALEGVVSADVSLENNCAVLTLDSDVSDKLITDTITENEYTVVRIEA